MNRYFVGVDLGATSGRVILATLCGDGIALEVLHRFPNRLLSIGGKYYWNIYSLYEEILHGLTLAGQRRIPVDSIGIDTWGVDMACVAADGTLAGLPRATATPMPTGFPVLPENTPAGSVPPHRYQIMNFNSLFSSSRTRGCRRWKMPRRCFHARRAVVLLTGEKVCEYTILSTSQFMDPRTREIDGLLLREAGVDPALFPRVVMPGRRIGALCDAVARQTGLGAVPVVAVAGHDTASAVAAVPARNGCFAYLSSGTWSLMGIEVREPIITEESYAMNFTNEGGVDGTVRFLKNITGMWLLEQCRAVWSRQGREYSYEEIVRMTEGAAPSPGVIDPDAAEFAAPTDMPQAIRAWCAAHGVPSPADDAALMRLIFDSLAAKYAEVLGKLRRLAPFEIECLHVIGGGAQNDLLNRMTADAVGIPVVAGPAEATALGNIAVQLIAEGLAADHTQITALIQHSEKIMTAVPQTSMTSQIVRLKQLKTQALDYEAA
ncbi:MAG: rhamnulokinase [Alistipes sp.]